MVIILSNILLLASCKKEPKVDAPDVSHIKADFDFIRFDKLLYETDSTDIPELYATMKEAHPAFLFAYPKVMTAPGTIIQDTVDFLRAMKHPGLYFLYDTTRQILGDIGRFEGEFAQAFSYYKHYFPDRDIPNVYTYISEFSTPGFTSGPTCLGVSMDQYLGNEFPYDPLTFPAYIKIAKTPKHLVSKTLEALVTDLIGGVQGEQFLDYIITNGKMLFLLDKLQPYTPDSIILGYTAAQTQWCEENEYNMWSHFIHEELLYSTNMRDFRKLVNPSPHSSGMPDAAPGRTGNYMGWKIIEAYMKRHPDTSFEQLLALKDSKKLLTESKYKPKQK